MIMLSPQVFIIVLMLKDVNADCEEDPIPLFLLCVNACRVKTMLCLRRQCGRKYDEAAYNKCQELRMNCLMGCESYYGGHT